MKQYKQYAYATGLFLAQQLARFGEIFYKCVYTVAGWNNKCRHCIILFPRGSPYLFFDFKRLKICGHYWTCREWSEKHVKSAKDCFLKASAKEIPEKVHFIPLPSCGMPRKNQLEFLMFLCWHMKKSGVAVYFFPIFLFIPASLFPLGWW